MQDQIVEFASALRRLGVPVSLAESIDAQNVVDAIGAADRETFRVSLRSALVKSRQDQIHFDTLFPLFFNSSPSLPLHDLENEVTDMELGIIRELIQQLGEQATHILERLLRGDMLSDQELEKLARSAGLEHANDLRYQGWVARRMEQALRLEMARQVIMKIFEALEESGTSAGRSTQIKESMEENLTAWKDQMWQYVGRSIAENLEGVEIDQRSGLLDRPFATLNEAEMQVLRQQVRRLAALLRSRAALRQKRAKSGHLDLKATIRANLRYGGIPIEIKRRTKHVRPKLVVVCDISTSMRYCSELMLSLLYELQDQVAKTSAYVFIDRLQYITPDFLSQPAKQAVRAVLEKNPPGYYSTDLGFSLKGFERDHMHIVDNRTSFIIVGDGRNNYNDPNLSAFEKIAKRSHRTLWINPENEVQWTVGDSDMRLYAPLCDDVLKAGTLNELIAAVDNLLS